MRSFSLSVTLKLNTGTQPVYIVIHRLSTLSDEPSHGRAEREELAAGLARRAVREFTAWRHPPCKIGAWKPRGRCPRPGTATAPAGWLHSAAGRHRARE